MKNFLRIIAALLLVSTLVTCFASCEKSLDKMTDEEKLSYLLKASENRYSRRFGISTLINSEMDGVISGETMNSTLSINETLTVLNADKSNFSYSLIDVYESVSGEGESKETSKYTKTKGYAEGFLFQGYTPGEGAEGQENYMKSECSPEDAWDFFVLTFLNNSDTDITNVYSEISSQKNDDGTWTLVLSGVRDGEKGKVAKFFSEQMAAVPFDMALGDFTLTFVSSEGNRAIKKMSVEASFSSYARHPMATQGDKMELHINMESEFDRPDKKTQTAPANFSAYKQNGDIRYSYYAQKALDDLIATENVKIEYYNHERYMTANRTVEGKNDGVIYYKRTLDKYLDYTITQRFLGQYGLSVDMNYFKGELKMGNSTTGMSEAAAKTYFRHLVYSPFTFDDKYVKEISSEVVREGRTRIKLIIDNNEYLSTLYDTIPTEENYAKIATTELLIDINEENELLYAEIHSEGRYYYFEVEHHMKLKKVEKID